jgi:hypothetical protein
LLVARAGENDAGQLILQPPIDDFAIRCVWQVEVNKRRRKQLGGGLEQYLRLSHSGAKQRLQIGLLAEHGV